MDVTGLNSAPSAGLNVHFVPFCDVYTGEQSVMFTQRDSLMCTQWDSDVYTVGQSVMCTQWDSL